MIARQLLATAFVPGGAELRLYAHDRDFMILMRREELMSTRMRGSEEALARLTLDRLGHPEAPRMLIGGYGMGFTLRAALAATRPGARITVAELVPEIIEWARGPMAAVADGCLDDPRVTLVIDDVARVIGEATDHYDAILLDVDNGPDGIVHPGNDRLYSPAGLARTRAALRRDGLLAVWSAAPDAGFTRRLRNAGFTVEVATTSARGNGKGPRHTIWFARR